MYYHSRGIIIKNIDFRETDKLVTVFTEERGKLKAIAKGVKKPGSSLRACIQPFCHSNLFFSSGKELGLITQAKLIDFFGNSREDISRTVYCIYIMQLLDKSLMDHMAAPDLYKTTLLVLDYFNKSGYNSLILRYFEMSLLISLGYKPVLDQCVCCRQSRKSMPGFSLHDGGMVCEGCKNQVEGYIVITGELLALMKLMVNGNLKTLSRVKVSENAIIRLENLIERYLEYQLERRFQFKSTIRALKKFLPIQ